MTAHVPYDDIPRDIRDLLDETYLPAGVEIWWNSRNAKTAAKAPRDVWDDPAARPYLLALAYDYTGGIAT